MCDLIGDSTPTEINVYSHTLVFYCTVQFLCLWNIWHSTLCWPRSRFDRNVYNVGDLIKAYGWWLHLYIYVYPQWCKLIFIKHTALLSKLDISWSWKICTSLLSAFTYEFISLEDLLRSCFLHYKRTFWTVINLIYCKELIAPWYHSKDANNPKLRIISKQYLPTDLLRFLH